MSTDIDECSESAANGCYDNSHCTNKNGGYTCSCPADYILKGDGKTCECKFLQSLWYIIISVTFDEIL